MILLAVVLLALGIAGIAGSMKRDQWWLLLLGLLFTLAGVMLLVSGRP